MSHQFAKRWFSVDEYYRMAEAGILTEDDRVEMVEGGIIEMSPIGSRHAACVKRLNSLLSRLIGPQLIVNVVGRNESVTSQTIADLNFNVAEVLD